MVPLIIVNFKTYAEGTGRGAAELAKGCEAAARQARGKVKVAVAVQAADIYRIANVIDTRLVAVYGQHIDSSPQGKFTGFATAEALREAGAAGTLLNHAEHKLGSEQEVEEHIAAAKRAGLSVVACAVDATEAKLLAELRSHPGCIAVEPPELIGGKVSVSTAKPGLISASANAVKKANPAIRVLCGAGVNSSKDVAAALKLGTSGILVASSVVLAKDPEKALLELIKGVGNNQKH